MQQGWQGWECKFQRFEPLAALGDGYAFEGYASLFGQRDQGGDVVVSGAYSASLARLAQSGRRVQMLWQHDATRPIGVWDHVEEDARGLRVKGRILAEVQQGREAAALLAAGVIDGLSIGYRVLRAERDGQGQRLLRELDLWEVSLVTFPMQATARVASKAAPAPLGEPSLAAPAARESRQALSQVIAALRQATADLKAREPF